MRLYLVRHAAAFRRDFARWPDDADRPLSPEGETRFRAAVRGLARVAAAPDVTLSSPFARAWRTAELLAEEGGWPVPAAEAALRAEATVEDAAMLVEANLDHDAVAMVGHEPNLGQLAAHLLTGGKADVRIDVKKGAVVCLDVDRGPEAWLRWSLSPKILRALESRVR